MYLPCIIWASTRETLSLVFENHKGADQPAHPRILISAFIIRLLESIISKLATSKFSIFQLVSVAEVTGLSLAMAETLKTGFVATRPNYNCILELSCVPLKSNTNLSYVLLP